MPTSPPDPTSTLGCMGGLKRMAGKARRLVKKKMSSEKAKTTYFESAIYYSPDCGVRREYIFRQLHCRTFQFKVKAKHNVSICLSAAPSEIPHQQYEIFIGGWGGGESCIRRNKRDDVKRIKTPDILSEHEFRGFWVVVTDHSIKVGKEGQAHPFLTHTDKLITFDVSHYGFCTAWGATGQWLFKDDGEGPKTDIMDYEVFLAVYDTPDCGENRKYSFRSMKTKTFKFYVKADHDANICLSPTDSETPHYQYELLLGNWNGHESAIRRNKADDVCKVKTPGLLNKNEFRGFWVTVTKHAIKVGKEGDSEPFLKHEDPALQMKLSYYGYCTAWGSTGQWMFADDGMGPANDMSFVVDKLEPSCDIGFKGDGFGHIFPPFCLDDIYTGIHQPWNPSMKIVPPALMDTRISESIKWVSCKSVSMCQAPVRAAPGENSPYVAIAQHSGRFQAGLVMPPNNDICHVPFGGKVVTKTDFYLLSNPGNIELVWLPGAKGNIPAGAVQGGIAGNGAPLYIGRVSINGSYINGKVNTKQGCCFVPYWGKEISHSSYEVLCFKTVPLSLLGLQ